MTEGLGSSFAYSAMIFIAARGRRGRRRRARAAPCRISSRIFACTVSRALRRAWISCTSSEGAMVRGGTGSRPPRAADLRRRARGEHRVEQIGGALDIASGMSAAIAFITMSLIAFGNFGFCEFRRRRELALHQPIEIRRHRRVVGQHPGEHLVHRHAERVDVRRKHRLALKLLRRHIRRAADDRGAVRGNLQEA